jgi:hypothetical protein
MPIRPLVLALLLVAAHANAATKPKAKPAPPAQEPPVENIDVDAMARAKDAAAGNSAAPPSDAAATTDTPPSSTAATPNDEPPSTPAEAPPTPPPAQAGQAAVPPLLAPAPDDAERRLAAACESRSTSLLDSAQKGDYTNATHDFDAKMRTAMPVPKFKQAWESLSQFGTLTARGQSHVSRGQGYIAVTIPLIFEKSNLFVQIACGSDGRIAGFNVKPLEIPKP